MYTYWAIFKNEIITKLKLKSLNLISLFTIIE